MSASKFYWRAKKYCKSN